LSDKATNQPDTLTARPSKNKSNSLISSAPSTSALTTDVLSTKNAVTINNAGNDALDSVAN